MNDVEPTMAEQDGETEITQQPAEPASAPGEWRMPEPKFQQSSGYLPQGFVEKVGQQSQPAEAAEAAATPKPDPAPAATAPAAEMPAVEPQPDLSEQIIPEERVTAPPIVAKRRSGAARVFMILLGLLGMALFIAIFLGVIYYLFLMPGDTGRQF